MTEEKGKKPIVINENDMGNNKKNTGFKKDKINYKLLAKICLIAIIVSIGIIIIVSTKKINIEKVKDSVVKINIYDKSNNIISTGSGFCAYDDNCIVTNFHVIEGARKIEIITDDNKAYSINQILIFSPNDDLALLSGNFSLKPLKIGNTNGLKAGDKVTAIGSPKGELNTVSTGIISNADNEYEIRITAPISPGSSGGALLNNKGEIIGVTFATFNAIDSQNINYAISAKYLDELHESYINKKYKEINEENYKNYAPDITNTTISISPGSFTNYTIEHGKFERPKPLSFCGIGYKYYAVKNMDTFYKATDKKNLFGNAIRNFGQYSLKDDYNQMTDLEKDEVVNNYEYFRTYDSYDKKLSSNMSLWGKEQFILELKLMQCQELSIFLVQAKKDDVVNILKKMGISYEKKIIIYKVFFMNDNSYNHRICNAVKENEFWTYNEKVEILKYLGMTVLSDGTIKW